MFENRHRLEWHAVQGHDREADALAEPCIANRECRRLFDRIMPQRERLDGGRMNVAAAADDHILLTAGGLCQATLSSTHWSHGSPSVMPLRRHLATLR